MNENQPFYSFDAVRRIVRDSLRGMNPQTSAKSAQLLIGICQEEQWQAAERDGWKMQGDGPPNYEMFGLHPLLHQPDDTPRSMVEIIPLLK